jgi:hypothetical protein
MDREPKNAGSEGPQAAHVFPTPVAGRHSLPYFESAIALNRALNRDIHDCLERKRRQWQRERAEQ